MRAVVSIPVHEKPEVIIDQIKNIQKYFPEAIILLHVSASYSDHYEELDVKSFYGVYINPEHLATKWGDIVMPHLSNFNYIQKLGIDYDYFVMHSSNDMYIRYGVANYISHYEAGFNLRYIRQKDTYWWPSRLAWEDPWLRIMMARTGQTKIVASQVEGSFYSKEITCKIMDVIQKSIDAGDADKKRGHYPREEIFFSTIAETVAHLSKVGSPYVFSEVHRFDSELWRVFRKTDYIYKRVFRYVIPRKLYDKLKAVYNGKKFDKGNYKITSSTVDMIVEQNQDFLDRYTWLDNGKSVDKLYGGVETLFAVKRVPREINDELRTYIRNLK